MKDYVIPTADYFEANGLIADKKHSIQLSSSSMGSENPGYRLKMVLSDGKKELPDGGEEQIRLLEEDLKEEIFKNRNISIVVCNENFVPVE